MHLKSKILLAGILGILVSATTGVKAMVEVIDESQKSSGTLSLCCSCSLSEEGEVSQGSEDSRGSESASDSEYCGSEALSLEDVDRVSLMGVVRVSPNPSEKCGWITFEKEFPIKELKCTNFDELIAKLRETQCSWRRKQIIKDPHTPGDVLPSENVYYYWVNTKLSLYGINQYNKWFGDNLEECKEDGCVALLPTAYGLASGDLKTPYAAPYISGFYKDIILNAGNWKLIGGGVQGSDSGLYLESLSECPTFESYINYLKSKKICC